MHLQLTALFSDLSTLQTFVVSLLAMLCVAVCVCTCTFPFPLSLLLCLSLENKLLTRRDRHTTGRERSLGKSNEQICLFEIDFCVQYAPVHPFMSDIKCIFGYVSISFVCHLTYLQIMLLSSFCG